MYRKKLAKYLPKIKIMGAALSVLTICSCTALQPFPNIVRGGDTVTFAVGSPEGMTRSNTTATFTSDVDGIPVDITANVRSIFKLYADPESKVYESTASTANLVNSSKHSPWITIVAIDLPQGLTIGTGNITFNTSANYPSIGSHINDLQLPIEIVAGTGVSNTFDYELGLGAQAPGDLSLLEAQPRAVFNPTVPSTACPCPDYAAIEIKTTIPTSLGTLDPSIARIVAGDLSVSTSSGSNFIYSTNGDDLTVIFVSTIEKLKYYEAQFSVVLHSASTFTGTPTINSVRYYDINGNEISGPVSDYNAVLE